jgi:restriction system protein
MALPKFEEFILPVLKIMSDKQTRTSLEICELVASQLNLNQEDKLVMVESGKKEAYISRTQWSIYYLYRAGLLNKIRKSTWEITSLGVNVVKSNPVKINSKYLMQFDSFKEYATTRKDDTDTEQTQKNINLIDSELSPIEAIDKAYEKLNKTLAVDLLDELLKASPVFFEKMVIKLLLKMGYGDFKEEAGKVTGKSGDEGIDGEISQDKLGLEKIYIQAKRYKDTVIGRPTIQQFAGSLLGKKANKGVFITTSDFSSEAKEYAKLAGQNIILIDGQKLVELMIEFNIGVSEYDRFLIKKVDHDFFTDDLI